MEQQSTFQNSEYNSIFNKDRIKQYIFPYIDSNMYIVIENSEALVIDPHISVKATKYLQQYQVKKVVVILTHEHFDHTCGVSWFREHYETEVICQEEALNLKRQKHFSRPLFISLILSDRGEYEKIKRLEEEYSIQLLTAEKTFAEKLDFSWQGHQLYLEHIPGHSPASSLIILDEIYVFTGDSLIPDASPTIRWPWSDEEVYYSRTIPRLLQLSPKSIIYPGHRSVVKMGNLYYENGMFIKK